jgi:hypothetical protein
MGFGTVWLVFALVAIVGAVIAAICVAIIQSKKALKKQKMMVNHLSLVKEFSASKQVLGSDGKTGLAIDEQRKKICLIDCRLETVSHRVISYKDLLSSEIFEDGTTITKTVRSSQVGSALIGGLALGGIGAIIGGLSGKTQTSGKVNRVDLRLTVNDTNAPLHDINFLEIDNVKKDEPIYKATMQYVRQWHGLLEILIKRADIEDKENALSSISQNQTGSIADEIKKLAELRDAGLLSSEEFQQQKAKLLGT